LLLEWHSHLSDVAAALQKDPNRSDLPADAPVTCDRLREVIRCARQACGGTYARWQELIDRGDVPGLVAFASSPDGIGFRSTLVGALGRDLWRTKQYDVCRRFLRAAVDRYPQDVWLHCDLCRVCLEPPHYAEALRHASAACTLRPDSAPLQVLLGWVYQHVGSRDQSIAAYRKASALSPDYAVPYRFLVPVLLAEKDWEGAIAPAREAIRLSPEPELAVQARRNLAVALTNAGCPEEALAALRDAVRIKPDAWAAHLQLVVYMLQAEQNANAFEHILDTLQRYPDWADDPKKFLRFNGACAAVRCAEGKGANASPPADRPAYRKQALEFLIADLAAIRKLADPGGTVIHWNMKQWLQVGYLASVRDPMAVEKLPPEEREAWEKLWSDVRDLHDRTAPKSAAPLAK
jgi:tetratricopeptide (TPR) repeat protein